MPHTAPTSDLSGWTRSSFSHGGLTHDRYERGSGPGVVLIPEVPGDLPGAFATNVRCPITDYLRALAADLNARTPGSGVGVVGMCFTGGFALAAAFDDSVVASVVSRPGVPFPLGRALGLRFSEDPVVPRARFDTIKQRLGDAFEVIELDSRPGDPDGYAASAHPVLTNEVRDRPANSAHRARARVVAFLRERLAS